MKLKNRQAAVVIRSWNSRTNKKLEQWQDNKSNYRVVSDLLSFQFVVRARSKLELFLLVVINSVANGRVTRRVIESVRVECEGRMWIWQNSTKSLKFRFNFCSKLGCPWTAHGLGSSRFLRLLRARARLGSAWARIGSRRKIHRVHRLLMDEVSETPTID